MRLATLVMILVTLIPAAVAPARGDSPEPLPTRWMAPHTPPPGARRPFAALTIASTSSRVMSPRWTRILSFDFCMRSALRVRSVPPMVYTPGGPSVSLGPAAADREAVCRGNGAETNAGVYCMQWKRGEVMGLWVWILVAWVILAWVFKDFWWFRPLIRELR